MNKAKGASGQDGKTFLKGALSAEAQVLAVQLALSSKSITHDGVVGDVNEDHFIHFLKTHLPRRYEVGSGIVIDSNGATSDQIDVIIFDHQYTPTLLDQQAHRYIPAEAVYAVLEAKPTINKQYLDYAAEKAHSVRVLQRTSVEVTHVDGKSPPKALFPIVAGIVAPKTEWVDGLTALKFAENLRGYRDTRILDCGVVLSDRAFDVYSGSLELSEKEGALASFLFRLLGKLQSLGTVPAVDWNKYAAVLSKV